MNSRATENKLIDSISSIAAGAQIQNERIDKIVQQLSNLENIKNSLENNKTNELIDALIMINETMKKFPDYSTKIDSIIETIKNLPTNNSEISVVPVIPAIPVEKKKIVVDVATNRYIEKQEVNLNLPGNIDAEIHIY